MEWLEIHPIAKRTRRCLSFGSSFAVEKKGMNECDAQTCVSFRTYPALRGQQAIEIESAQPEITILQFLRSPEK